MLGFSLQIKQKGNQEVTRKRVVTPWVLAYKGTTAPLPTSFPQAVMGRKPSKGKLHQGAAGRRPLGSSKLLSRHRKCPFSLCRSKFNLTRFLSLASRASSKKSQPTFSTLTAPEPPGMCHPYLCRLTPSPHTQYVLVLAPMIPLPGTAQLFLRPQSCSSVPHRLCPIQSLHMKSATVGTQMLAELGGT